MHVPRPLLETLGLRLGSTRTRTSLPNAKFEGVYYFSLAMGARSSIDLSAFHAVRVDRYTCNFNFFASMTLSGFDDRLDGRQTALDDSDFSLSL